MNGLALAYEFRPEARNPPTRSAREATSLLANRVRRGASLSGLDLAERLSGGRNQVPYVFRSTPEEREAWQVRVASNQSRFREVNEGLEELNRDFSEIIPTGDFVCECADTDCLERVGLTIEEYEQLRSVPTHFAVRHGHIACEAEQVVEEHIGYTVVETIGAAADYAESANPRG